MKTNLKTLTLLIAVIFVMIAFGLNTKVNAITYTEVGTFEALQTAISNGENIKLTANISTTTSVLTINKTLTMDLNGFTYSGGVVGTNINKTIVVTGATTTFTIEDSTGTTGKIKTPYTSNTSVRVISIENGAKVILNSGTISTEGITKGSSAVFSKHKCYIYYEWWNCI